MPFCREPARFPAKICTVNYLARITRHPDICGGEGVIAGTRVTLRTVLASLAEGATIKEICQDFPTLTEADVRCVIAYAAASAADKLGVPSVEVP